MSEVQQPDKTRNLKLHFLVLRCQVGDEGAFRELHALFSVKTLRYLKSVVGNEDGEDLNQEVWLTVYNRIKTVTNPSGFRLWLFQMARNRTMDFFRRNKRLSEYHEAYKVEVDDEIFDQSSEVTTEEELKELEMSLENLPQKHQEVLILNFLEGMDYEEIALITSCSLGTVKSRIYNAKVKLKYLMNKN